MNDEGLNFASLFYVIFTAINVYLAIVNWRMDNTPDFVYHAFFSLLFGASYLLGINNGTRR